ncbi:hypothetical protein DPEC_G00211880 [Dallia pectoralis]|uniref:Uncharacterized protein n=1 Tax=Dallia pectoralis TaxID=75939 RepID=A0ACC2G696_DALPE|nr:hypothetical protein DPEC_G00211880 [Dallia pectoralis]
MENTDTAKIAQKLFMDDVTSGLDLDEYDGFIGGTGETSDRGQNDMVSDGVDEDTYDDDDYEEEEERSAVQPKDQYEDPSPRIPSIWATAKYISKWKMAHRRGYHMNCLTDVHERKAVIMQQELDCRTSIPLPMLCMIEKAALQILQNTEKDYKSKLGANHHMTKELHEHIESLKSQLFSKTGVSESAPGGVLETLFRSGRAVFAMLGRGMFRLGRAVSAMLDWGKAE